MATIAQTFPAATLVMIAGMTFRLPDGAYAALYVRNFWRDSREGTRRAARSLLPEIDGLTGSLASEIAAEFGGA